MGKRDVIIRKTHRYLGVVIGIQFLGWTLGGLYFSWSNLDKVHGDHLRKPVPHLSADLPLVSPTLALSSLRQKTKVDSIQGIHLIRVLGKPVYQIVYFEGQIKGHLHPSPHYALAYATTGTWRNPIDREEALAIAKEHVVSTAVVEGVEYIEQTGAHHEYREKPLPAWAVSFKNPDCTVYISATMGTFQSIRHDQWRAFDFLWMLHTMDYEGRDNFNNILLQAFSWFGLVTVLSGFLLFFVSSRTLKKSMGFMGRK